MATTATMNIHDAKPDQSCRGIIGVVDGENESFELGMSVEAVAQLLALKSVEITQLQRTHDEYVKSSCEYERELEIEVDRYEKKTQQLEFMTSQLERDQSNLRSSMTGLNDDLKAAHRREYMITTQLEEMKWKIQKLEQANDELETSARISQATIEDLQHQSETLIEQNVFLQHEKDELAKRLSSIIIAEVHPATFVSGDQVAVSRSASACFNRKSSSRLLEAAHGQENGFGKVRKRRGRRPEVLETCLHLTCRKCRANIPHAHNGGSDELGSVAAFFERLRIFLFGPEH